MRRRATLVIDRKFTLEDGSIVEAVVWELPIPLKGSPHRYNTGSITAVKENAWYASTMSKGRATTSTSGVWKLRTHSGTSAIC